MTDPTPAPQPPHWMRPKPKKLRVLADPDFDHDPILQYAIMRWWGEHEFPLLEIFRATDEAPILTRIETLVQGDRIMVTNLLDVYGSNREVDGVIALSTGRRLSRQLRRSTRWHGAPVTVYRVDER